MILGKQRQPVITPVLQDTLRSYLAQGGNLLVSGTNLFSDSWGNAQDRTFVEEVLKGKLASRNASKEGIVNSCASPYGYINGRYTFRTRPNPICYSIESVDGVLPADKLAHTILRYPENNIGAGIVYEGKYRTCLLSFPFEALQTPSERNRLMSPSYAFSPFNNKIKYSIYNETNQLLYPLWKNRGYTTNGSAIGRVVLSESDLSNHGRSPRQGYLSLQLNPHEEYMEHEDLREIAAMPVPIIR